MRPYDLLFSSIWPYAALVIAAGATLDRRRHRRLLAPLPPPLVERPEDVCGALALAAGLVGVLVIHVVAMVAPGAVLAWNAEPIRLYALEVAGLSLGLLALYGLANVILGRLRHARKRTTVAEWAFLGLLLVHLGLGVHSAVAHRFGSSWFASQVAPYVLSLARFEPDPGAVAPLPLGARLHMGLGFGLVALLPFTRFIAIAAGPITRMILRRREGAPARVGPAGGTPFGACS